MKHILTFLLSACLPVACSNEPVKDAERIDTLPTLFPDYIGVTVPATIAPLNFSPADSTVTGIDVVVTGTQSGSMHVQGSNVARFPRKAWRRLLQENRGDSLSLTVSFKTSEGWKQYRSFGIYVSPDSIDYGLNYRLIAPGYEVYSRMGIYERRLTDYHERALLENTRFDGCVNCHSYNRNNPDLLSLHVRGPHGATLLRGENQRLRAYNTVTNFTPAACTYPYWHPSGNYIAYSTNSTRQGFHWGREKLIEVFDLASDLQLYDLRNDRLLVPPVLKQDSVWETFPAFSPDGKHLYFCAAQARPIPDEIEQVRYNLYRIGFHAESGTFDTQIDTLLFAEGIGKSVSFPRPSFDGRYLMFTLSDYGQFSIWHPEADLWLLDLQTGESLPLTAANSPHTESYHSWSSNSRWFVFASRRIDGLHTCAYLCHIDAEGRPSKPFLLPQDNPKQFYGRRFLSYNIPEFVTKPTSLDDREVEALVTSKERVQMKP